MQARPSSALPPLGRVPLGPAPVAWTGPPPASRPPPRRPGFPVAAPRLDDALDPSASSPCGRLTTIGVAVCSGSGSATPPRSRPAAPMSHPAQLDAVRMEMAACTTTPTDAPRCHQARTPDLKWRTMASSTPRFSSRFCRDKRRVLASGREDGGWVP